MMKIQQNQSYEMILKQCLEENVITLNPVLGKKKSFKSNELYLNYEKLETIKQQNESKADRKKKIVKIKTEHEIANRKAIEKNQ